MNKLLFSLIAILMIVVLALVWLVFQQNERANRLAEELYKEPVVQSADINWVPTYIIIQDPQGRARARGTIFLVNTVWDTEVK